MWSTSWFRNRDAEVARVRQAWLDACAASDAADDPPPAPAGPAAVATSPTAAATVAASPPPTADPPRSGPCPVRSTGGPITDYRPDQLAALVRWINSDTLLRSDDQVMAEAMAVLGFQKRGQRIVAALEQAIRDANNT